MPPPQGARCDTYSGGIDTCACHTPDPGEWCQNEPVETVLPAPGRGVANLPLYLCEACRDALVERGLVIRNPKRKKPAR